MAKIIVDSPSKILRSKIWEGEQKIKNLLERGVEEIIERESLEKKLRAGKRLRIKHGIDPTGPKIHIGRAIQFWKLRIFQELGHQIVLIIGDFTAQIGDASDKQAMRRPLTEKEVKKNMKDYVKQIGKILDMRKTEIRHNSEWLGKLKAKDLLNLEMNFTCQQMIHRRNFEERWQAGKPVGVHELNYPILQGYDSVAVKADVEIGGSDQLFNLKVGRELQRIFGQKPQDIMTSKMLSGLEGGKMSTSAGNIITIADEPKDMFGKLMSMTDEMMPEYFELCTFISLEEIEEIKKAIRNKTLNPRDAKIKLAENIVSLYYGEKAAQKAKEEFIRVFSKKEAPSEAEVIKLSRKNIIDALAESKAVKSKSEARRLIAGKGIKIGGEIVGDATYLISENDENKILRLGKKRFYKIKLSY